MMTTRSIPILPGLAAVLSLVCTGLPAASAQRPAYPIVQEIHVDGNCRLLPAPSPEPAVRKKQRPIKDPVICHVESPHTSEHMEEAIVGHELHRDRVEIAEQEFVLQNIAADPVIFVVEQPVAKGWQIDSDPLPASIEEIGDSGGRHPAKAAIALFRVHAQPGEIVRLHVGERHAIALKPKVIAASVTTTQASN
jgi:hypothetical protein